MEPKDYFYVFGIIASFLIGLFNIRMMLKNRRNAMREHIYKEQIKTITELVLRFNKFNLEIDSLINNIDKKKENDFQEKFEKLGNFLFENQFILPNDIITLSNNALTKSSEFYYEYLSTQNVSEIDSYEIYYSAFNGFLVYARGYFGIDSLSLENQKIHGIPSYVSSKTIEKITKNTAHINV